MPTIKIQAQLSKEDLLEAAEQLSLSELDEFVQDIIALKAQHQTPNLSKDETELLLKINQGLGQDLENRYHFLISKRKQETLTEPEYEELLHLTDLFEIQQAQRLESLTKLAQLRQVSLSNLMIELEIKPSINA